MGIGFVFPLILLLGLYGQNPANDNAPVSVLSSKWITVRQAGKQQEAPNVSPPPEMTAANKSAARAARVNNPLIPDPNEQTIDGRSAAIDKAVQQARSNTPRPVNGFEYQARIQNAVNKNIEI